MTLRGCALLLAAACAGGPAASPVVKLAMRPDCAPPTRWDGVACRSSAPGLQTLATAVRALEAFRVEDAVTLLERARREGPHALPDLIRIYEQLGVAHAYLGNEQAAMDAFDMLLALDAGHLLSYELSPKATFVFERARERALERTPTMVDVRWPYDRLVSDAVPIDVEVVADPRGLLSRAVLHVRRRGEKAFRVVPFALAAPGERARLLLPPLDAQRPEVVELYLTAFDREGNEAHGWAAPEHPRTIALGYRPPVPWHRKWWVWAIVGGAVAAGAATTAYAVGQEPPDTIGGEFSVRR